MTLTEQQDAWIAAQVDAGDYNDDSEAIRDLIRREQEWRFGTEAVREALSAGEYSGTAEAFDFAAFKQRKAAELG
ncbi:type II toxin-antitoxin system ParD family antitoxin [Sphingomonas sp. PP-CE-1G-424]|uniref:type II toxin-antitoxin system ParD family antitoxin n=1 Tax=Sphingomonas sp. PP-CE-1G-424 TaxID=2135658 RepID=UPI002436CE76|nr:type II toxin-antitoxin system ParD family antitoxin [Sphingomonas sp. PP-CE-1G-424]